jgi:hypothetical protein
MFPTGKRKGPQTAAALILAQSPAFVYHFILQCLLSGIVLFLWDMGYVRQSQRLPRTLVGLALFALMIFSLSLLMIWAVYARGWSSRSLSLSLLCSSFSIAIIHPLPLPALRRSQKGPPIPNN